MIPAAHDAIVEDRTLKADCTDKARVSLVEVTAAPGLTFSLAAAYLQAYAESMPNLSGHFRFDRLVSYGGNGTDAIVEDIARQARCEGIPAALAFTIYFWNRDATCRVIERVRTLWPAIFIIVGGNDIEAETREAFVENPLVDFVCFGEGETVFAEILCEIAEIQTGHVARSGKASFRSARQRIEPIAQVPSPFLTGVVESEEIRSAGMIIYETNRGCPFLCSFCYWGGAVGSKVRRFGEQRVRDEIRLLLTHMRSGATLFLADANFGMHKHDIAFARLLRQEVRRSGKRLMLFVNWAKNTSDRVVETARVLFESDLIGAVTLSAQSMTPSALEACGRKNIPYNQYIDNQARFCELGIPTYTELILGLPPESVDEFYAGIENVLQGGGHPVVYPLLLLRNTDLNSPEKRRKWALDVQPMPYQFVGSNGAVVDTVVGHVRLSREEWRAASEFVLVMAVVYHVFARETVRSACRHLGVSQVEGLREIHGALLDATLTLPGDAPALFRNHRESLADPRRFDRAMIEARLGAGAIPDHLHYQAIVTEMIDRMIGDWSLLDDFLDASARTILGDGGDHRFVKSGMESDRSWVRWLAQALRPGHGARDVAVAPDALLLGVYHGAVSRHGVERKVTE